MTALATRLALPPVPPVPASVTNTISHAWQQDVMTMVRDRLPKVLIILVLLFLAQRVVHFFVTRMHKAADRVAGTTRKHAARSAQLRTAAAIIRATSYSIFGALAFLQILTLLNINFAPLLASAGIVGVGIGLAAQSLFKDIINGTFILVEDQYNVGEVVKIASLTGTVEDLTLRTTRLRDFDGTMYIIPNSQIATVANLSRDYSSGVLNVTVDASANPDMVIETLQTIAAAVAADPRFETVLIGKPTVLGVDKLDGRSVGYPILVQVQPLKKDDIMRELRRQIVLIFEQKGIPMGVDPNMLVRANHDATAPPAQQPLVAP